MQSLTTWFSHRSALHTSQSLRIRWAASCLEASTLAVREVTQTCASSLRTSHLPATKYVKIASQFATAVATAVTSVIGALNPRRAICERRCCVAETCRHNACILLTHTQNAHAQNIHRTYAEYTQNIHRTYTEHTQGESERDETHSARALALSVRRHCRLRKLASSLLYSAALVLLHSGPLPKGLVSASAHFLHSKS